MLLYPFGDLGRSLAPMDDIFARIIHGCERARDLEANLVGMADRPHLLLESCKAIVAEFEGAIDRLSSDPEAVLGEAQGSGRRRRPDGAAADEVSLGGDLFTVRDLLNTRIDMTDGESRPLFASGLTETEVGFPSELPELGLQIPITSAPGSFGFRAGGGGGGGGRVDDTEDDHFDRSASSQPAASTVEVSGSARNPTADPHARRSMRKRKGGGEEARTVRIPALRLGNLEIPPDDGYTWRKYGQKEILGARFPRSYYRCTHKNFYGCEAKKQVQRLDDDPFTFEVTYCGGHGCRTSPTPYLIMSNDPNNPPAPAGTTTTELAGTSALAQLPPSLSTSMQLGSWFTAGGTDGSQKDEGDRAGLHRGESSTAPASSSELRCGRDAEYTVAALADVMFNSIDIDSIFSSKKES